MVDVVSKVSTGDVDDGPKAVGTGKPIIEVRKAEAATAVEFSGALTVEIRSGAPSLRIEAQKEVLPHIKSEFDGGRLRVWTEGSMTNGGTMRVWLTTPALSDIRASGATTVDAGSISGGSIKLQMDGASKIEAKGSVDSLKLNLTGASTATTRFVASKRVEVHLDGASTAFLSVSDTLTGEVSGASTVCYQKHPAVILVQTCGDSNVTVDK